MPAGDYWPLYRLQQAFLVNVVQHLGGTSWYVDGATAVMEQQVMGGSWEENIADTSFALLFLQRATVPGVPTGRSVTEVVETKGGTGNKTDSNEKQ